ncbi:hypothetical protein J2T09_000561 [Neorhizobium huautlense]|uniref:DUF982 domain-containing protein n=2 Tax=Neorhizobium huautlense TaxID=67774 RepID=A0ABT9PPM5_9HYPH|nr:hypothetical protein [Neorhizobium huautlense]
MMQKPWNKPVVVMIGEPPVETAIETTQAASWAMIEDWPIEDEPACDKALLIFAEVSKGKRADEDARQAFLAAAVEAGILVRK